MCPWDPGWKKYISVPCIYKTRFTCYDNLKCYLYFVGDHLIVLIWCARRYDSDCDVTAHLHIHTDFIKSAREIMNKTQYPAIEDTGINFTVGTD